MLARPRKFAPTAAHGSRSQDGTTHCPPKTLLQQSAMASLCAALPHASIRSGDTVRSYGSKPSTWPAPRKPEAKSAESGVAFLRTFLPAAAAAERSFVATRA